jgi:hypothetical protein
MLFPGNVIKPGKQKRIEDWLQQQADDGIGLQPLGPRIHMGKRKRVEPWLDCQDDNIQPQSFGLPRGFNLDSPVEDSKNGVELYEISEWRFKMDTTSILHSGICCPSGLALAGRHTLHPQSHCPSMLSSTNLTSF